MSNREPLASTDPLARSSLTRQKPERADRETARTWRMLLPVWRPARHVKAVVLSGRGPARSARARTNRRDGGARCVEAATLSHRWQAIMDRFAHLPQVTIAAVHGHALGGGCMLAAAQDLRLADGVGALRAARGDTRLQPELRHRASARRDGRRPCARSAAHRAHDRGRRGTTHGPGDDGRAGWHARGVRLDAGRRDRAAPACRPGGHQADRRDHPGGRSGVEATAYAATLSRRRGRELASRPSSLARNESERPCSSSARAPSRARSRTRPGVSPIDLPPVRGHGGATERWTWREFDRRSTARPICSSGTVSATAIRSTSTSGTVPSSSSSGWPPPRPAP